MTGLWVAFGPGLPCGARCLGDEVLGSAPAGKAWLDVCILGQHLPQMYPNGEIRVLDAAGCGRLGLCPDCLGFGDAGPQPAQVTALHAARGIDQVERLCQGCGGSGRPAVRVTVSRDFSGITGTLRPLPHAYVPPLEDAGPEFAAASGVPEGMCLACGMPPGGKGPRGEALHP